MSHDSISSPCGKGTRKPIRHGRIFALATADTQLLGICFWREAPETASGRSGGRGKGGCHVKIAVGRDYGDVAPVRGSYLGTGHCRMEVRVDVEKVL